MRWIYLLYHTMATGTLFQWINGFRQDILDGINDVCVCVSRWQTDQRGERAIVKRFKMELRYVLIGMYDIYVCVIALSLFSLARLTQVIDMQRVKVKDR